MAGDTTTQRQIDTRLAQAARVADYLEDNPDSTLKEIDAGCDVGSVSKVLSVMSHIGYEFHTSNRLIVNDDHKYKRRVKTYAVMHRPEIQGDQALSASMVPTATGRNVTSAACPMRSSCTRRMTAYLMAHLAWRQKEVFTAIFLDERYRIIGSEDLAWGSSNVVNIEIAEIAKVVVRHGAKKIVVAHNHPVPAAEFGYTTSAAPSAQDIAFTRRLCLVMHLVGIPLLDHIIVGADKSSYSMAAEGPWLEPLQEFMRLIYLD